MNMEAKPQPEQSMQEEQIRTNALEGIGEILVPAAVQNRLARVNSPQRHTAEQPVSHDERVKQNRSKVGDKREEQ
jgi:hypothetical protein